MATVSKEAYLRILEARPYKFDQEEVNYRDAEGEDRCENCQHFYARVVDKFHTCEIFRNEETDEEGVDPAKVCDFWTDGKEPDEQA